MDLPTPPPCLHRVPADRWCPRCDHEVMAGTEPLSEKQLIRMARYVAHYTRRLDVCGLVVTEERRFLWKSTLDGITDVRHS